MEFIIKEVFAFTTIDEDGTEGVIGFRSPDGQWMPLVGADMERVESLMPIAKSIGEVHNKRIFLKRFELKDSEEITS